HADTDSEHRTPASETALDQLRPVDRSQGAHHSRESANSGNEQAVSFGDLSTVCRQLDIRSGQLERLDSGVDVATAVVEDSDGRSVRSDPIRWDGRRSEGALG